MVTVGGRPDRKFARAWGLSLPLGILGFLNRKVDRLARKKRARFEYLFMRASGEQLERVGALVDQGVIKPVLDKTFPLEAAVEAVSYVESGRAVGKVVIRVADEDAPHDRSEIHFSLRKTRPWKRECQTPIPPRIEPTC